MKYKIIVDKQSRKNPSSEKREYEIDIEELRCKGDVYDSLVITKDEDYVMRRLSLSKYHVLSILKEPIKQPLKDINIQLFEGENYIYLSDIEGNRFYAEYLIKNDFNDVYITKSEANSTINQTAEKIEISVSKKLENYPTTEVTNTLIEVLSDKIDIKLEKKVNDDEIISAINMTPEKIKILSKLIQLEGYTTINGGFSIDTAGNASIANGAVKINNNGVELADGKKVIGGDGVYCNLQFFPPQQYCRIGYCMMGDNVEQEIIRIYADIPNNFTIQNAYITIRHQPVTWEYYKNMIDIQKTNIVGYARNVQIYTDNLSAGAIIDADSEYPPIQNVPGEKTNSMGTNGKTFSNSVIEVAKSADLKSYLKSGELTVFNIGSITNASSIKSSTEAYAKTRRSYSYIKCYGISKNILI